MDLDQTTQIDPVLLKLIVTTTTLNEKINGSVSDGGISWGCTPTIMDLSESDAIKNCCLCKVLQQQQWLQRSKVYCRLHPLLTCSAL